MLLTDKHLYLLHAHRVLENTISESGTTLAVQICKMPSPLTLLDINNIVHIYIAL